MRQLLGLDPIRVEVGLIFLVNTPQKTTRKKHHQGEKVKAMTVVCSCGVSFCFTCKQIGGHEPVPWQGWGEGEKGIKTLLS